MEMYAWRLIVRNGTVSLTYRFVATNTERPRSAGSLALSGRHDGHRPTLIGPAVPRAFWHTALSSLQGGVSPILDSYTEQLKSETNMPLRTRPARGGPVIDHASFQQVCTVRRNLVELDASNVRLLTAAYATRKAVVIKGALTEGERMAISESWDTFATAHSELTYSTYEHAKRSLTEVWSSGLGMRMETSLREREGNPVEAWLSHAEEPAVRRLHATYKRLMQLGAALSEDANAMRHPAFVTGRIRDGAGSTHNDDYHNFALMAVGCKVLYISKSTGGSPAVLFVELGLRIELAGSLGRPPACLGLQSAARRHDTPHGPGASECPRRLGVELRWRVCSILWPLITKSSTRPWPGRR